ncbi:tetratricopeptide repeat protein, partial [Klebsiella pneumoniae]
PYPMFSVLNTLARLNTKRGDYAAAESLYKRHLSSSSSNGKVSASRSLIEDLTCIGIVCQRQRKYAEAEPYYQRALDVLA